MFVLLGEVRWTPRAPRRGADRGRRHGPRVRRRRILGVRRPGPAAEPREPAAVQPAAPLLPGQLAVLRPERLRPLSGAHPGRARRLSRLVAWHRLADPRRARLGASCWRRSRSATRSPASSPWWRACWSSRRFAGASGGRSAGGAAILVCGAIFLLVSGTGRYRPRLVRRASTQRPVAGWIWSRAESAGARPPRLGLGLRLVRRRVLPPHPAGETTVVALGAAHRRRRAGGIGLVVYAALVVLALARPAQRRKRLGWRPRR